MITEPLLITLVLATGLTLAAALTLFVVDTLDQIRRTAEGLSPAARQQEWLRRRAALTAIHQGR